MRRKVNFLPNIITTFGLCCGLYIIFKMNMLGPGEMTRDILISTTGILLLAAFADLLDGAVARVMKVESEFGGLFDSMTDAVTFGVAPSVIILKTLSLTPGTEWSYLMTTAAMIYSVCGVLRLVRFNVNSNKIANDQELREASKKNFTGLPIPAAAMAVVSGNQLLFSDEFINISTITPLAHMWTLFSMMILIGYFMVSQWKFPSLKTLRIKVTSFRQVFFIVVFTVFVVFYGFVQHLDFSFAFIAWGYVIVAWILSIIRVISGKRLKTLEDFEPEPDEIEEEQ